MNETKRILVAPLNWGLGHATRCIPLIEGLLRRNCAVFLASDGSALELLRKEFPQLEAFELPSYNVHYKGNNLMLSLALQSPKILMAIAKEKKETEYLIEENKIDGIISDNRYGCRSRKKNSVFICHQINLPGIPGFLSPFASFLHWKWIHRFDECWIPDWGGEPSLSGKLGHGHKLVNSKYIGPLSRMDAGSENKGKNILIVLSGPEPQRSILEELLYQQAGQLHEEVIFVRGKLHETGPLASTKTIKVVPFMNAEDLNEAMNRARIVIVRSGYSSIMDLVKKKKPAVLIPTPGQPEQEYLAKRMDEMKVFCAQKQDRIDLKKAIAELDINQDWPYQWDDSLLAECLDAWLNRI